MSLFRGFGLALLALLVMAPYPGPPDRHAMFDSAAWPDQGAALSVMTYNVKGLPWPLATGRAPALEAIGDRLRAMRGRGVQPHVVLLQEAFTDQAESIAGRAGYRYAARGPSVAPTAPSPPLGEAYLTEARWDRGEREANVLDSGLMILSDYPIVKVRRVAFPRGACAGFDCLASKGVLIAWIAVPGLDAPLAVADTHLNSRGSTHVARSRADAANTWQIAELRRELGRAIDPREPAIVGGDYNVGRVGGRLAAFASHPPLGAGQRQDLQDLSKARMLSEAAEAEAVSVLARNKEQLLSRAGTSANLEAWRAWVPFSLNEGRPLSDHFGYVVDYRIRPAQRTSVTAS